MGSAGIPIIKTSMSVFERDLAAVLAEKSPAYFGSWVTEGAYEVPRHVDYLSDRISAALEEGGARIIICAPPRHGKSELVNKITVAWWLWKNPARRVILSGHNSSFATTWGRKVRDLLCENRGRLGVDIRGNFDAAMDEWYTKQGGGMRCAGVGVGIVGLGADLFIIDDPIPDPKAAFSPVYQKELQDWYTGVVDRRLEPGASIIVSMQRWPGQDFVAWLTSLRDQGRENWVIIRLPDIYDAEEVEFGADPLGRDPMANNGLGEALWPERWPVKDLLHKKAVSEDLSFYYSQYRQRPHDKSREGLVYSSFDEYSVKPLQYNPRLPILWALDFNVDPMCSLVAQSQEDFDIRMLDDVLSSNVRERTNKTIHVLQEIYLRNSSTQAACDEFIKRLEAITKGDTRTVYVTVHGDASGHTRKTTSPPDYNVIRDKFRVAFGNRVVVTIRAPKNNPTQRNRVTTVNNAFVDASGERHLLIDPSCVETRRDLLFMKWRRDGSGNPTNDIDDSNQARGHISDALGYLAWGELRMTKPVGSRTDRLI